jgi:hypothetical protein
MSVTGIRVASAGVMASDVEPVYQTGAFLNVGDELKPAGLSLNVLSIPTSRLEFGVEIDEIVGALVREEEYSADAFSIVHQQRFIGDQAPMAALAWTVTAAAVRVLDRRDLDPPPGNIELYAEEVWPQLGTIEREVLGASQAPLFVLEQSPPRLGQAGSILTGGLATVSFALGHMSAATIIVTPIVIFLITAAPVAGRAFGEYLRDVIKRLPGGGPGDK